MRDPDGDLARADAEFDQMEQDMYNRIITRRDTMRLTNALSRVAQTRDKMIEKVQAEIDSLTVSLSNYDTQRGLLDDLRHSIEVAVPEIPAPDLQIVATNVTLECDTQANGINLNIKKSNSEAKSFVSALTQSITAVLNASLPQIFRLQDISQVLHTAYHQRLTEIESAVIGTPGASRATLLARRELQTPERFDVSALINIDNIVPDKRFWSKHSGEELIQYIGVVREQIAPSQTPNQIANPGILARTDIQRISASVITGVQDLVQTYNDALMSYFDSVSAAILANILPDYEQTRSKLETLKQLNADLKKITI